MENKGYVLYSASWCSNCPNMKLWLTQQGVDFVTLDIDSMESETLDALGLRSIPSLFKDDVCVGIGENIKPYIMENK